ncbi:hypothetical protein NA78x_001691 [Anatilimnocola sp. NA78]|uniref:hypothetical protein n=1 Tax=Anatilimnocola sp. NA78 TaxID=3415683 RepID=UPI003CE59D19
MSWFLLTLAALLGFVTAGNTSADTAKSAQAGCCCGAACVCADCQCVELGCDCDAGGPCVCDAACCASGACCDSAVQKPAAKTPANERAVACGTDCCAK